MSLVEEVNKISNRVFAISEDAENPELSSHDENDLAPEVLDEENDEDVHVPSQPPKKRKRSQEAKVATNESRKRYTQRMNKAVDRQCRLYPPQRSKIEAIDLATEEIIASRRKIEELTAKLVEAKSDHRSVESWKTRNTSLKGERDEYERALTETKCELIEANKEAAAKAEVHRVEVEELRNTLMKVAQERDKLYELAANQHQELNSGTKRAAQPAIEGAQKPVQPAAEDVQKPALPAPNQEAPPATPVAPRDKAQELRALYIEIGRMQAKAEFIAQE